MKKLFLLLLALVFIASCDDDEPLGPVTTVNLNLKAEYDGAPLVTYHNFTYPDGHLIRFQTFNFFISDVALLKEGSGEEEQLIEVDYADFSNNTTQAEAETPLVFSAGDVPAGNYSGIRIGIGVPADLNKESSGQFSSDHPLRKTFDSHFWSNWGSYIFMKSEGIYDLDGDGDLDGDDQGFEHHPGTNQVYETVTINTPIVLEKGKPYDLNFVVDLLKIYQGDTLLDLSNPDNRDTQEPTDMPLAIWLTGNFQQALKMDQ